jgi:site-specific DNA-methyltransferase (adenine-specific)
MEAMSLNVTGNADTRREDWSTPVDLFATLSRSHDFVIDLCASRENALCDFWIPEGIDIFSPLGEEIVFNAARTDHVEHPYAWINPPYQGSGKTGLFVVRAAELCRAHGLGLVALIPASVGSAWWRESVDPFFDFVLFTPRLRFGGAPSGAQFDSAICIMRSPGERDLGPDMFHLALGAPYKRLRGSI